MYAIGQFFCIKNLQNHEKSKIELPFFFSISIELIGSLHVKLILHVQFYM